MRHPSIFNIAIVIIIIFIIYLIIIVITSVFNRRPPHLERQGVSWKRGKSNQQQEAGIMSGEWKLGKKQGNMRGADEPMGGQQGHGSATQQWPALAWGNLRRQGSPGSHVFSHKPRGTLASALALSSTAHHAQASGDGGGLWLTLLPLAPLTTRWTNHVLFNPV